MRQNGGLKTVSKFQCWIIGGRLVSRKGKFIQGAEREVFLCILESGWPMTANCVGCANADFKQPKDASGKPVPGWNLQVLKENGAAEATAGELGRIVAK